MRLELWLIAAGTIVLVLAAVLTMMEAWLP